MAHESFEDAEVAAEMNRYFVNIKVDREERPDLDQIYQLAHAMLTQRGGGWPLTMFLTPDGTPFFGGTYFPKHARYGMPGFLDLLPRIADAYRDKREEIAQQNAALIAALKRTLPAAGGRHRAGGARRSTRAVRELAQVFDDVHGGIGRAPKFPHPVRARLLPAPPRARRRRAGPRDRASDAREDGRGRHLRPDRRRLLPLQRGPVLERSRTSRRCSTTTRRCSRSTATPGSSPACPLFEQRRAGHRAMGRCARCSRREGGFYSSLDADSEHEEGKFYVWTPAEVRALLTPEEYAVVEPHYGLDGAPNFEGQALASARREAARRRRRSGSACRSPSARRGSPPRARKLLAAREQRVRPGRDDKVLTSWNALMIRGLARAARVFGEPGWLAAAQRALDFVRAHAVAARRGRRRARQARRDLQGRRGASERLSRRSRVPARRAARAHARRVSRARISRSRASSPKSCSSASRTAPRAASSSCPTTTRS